MNYIPEKETMTFRSEKSSWPFDAVGEKLQGVHREHWSHFLPNNQSTITVSEPLTLFMYLIVRKTLEFLRSYFFKGHKFNNSLVNEITNSVAVLSRKLICKKNNHCLWEITVTHLTLWKIVIILKLVIDLVTINQETKIITHKLKSSSSVSSPLSPKICFNLYLVFNSIFLCGRK